MASSPGTQCKAEVNLCDEAALKAAYDAVQALMAFPQ